MNATTAPAWKPSPQWNDHAAEQIARKLAKNHRRLFAAYHDVDGDDLHQIALTGCMKADTTWTPDMGRSWANWLWLSGERRIIDYFRSREAERRRIENSMPKSESVQTISENLLAMADRAMEAAAERLPEFSSVKSNHIFTVHQLAACLLIREHTRASYRGVVMMLEGSRDMRERLGLTRVPTRSALCEANRRIRRITKAMRLMAQNN